MTAVVAGFWGWVATVLGPEARELRADLEALPMLQEGSGPGQERLRPPAQAEG